MVICMNTYCEDTSLDYFHKEFSNPIYNSLLINSKCHVQVPSIMNHKGQLMIKAKENKLRKDIIACASHMVILENGISTAREPSLICITV